MRSSFLKLNNTEKNFFLLLLSVYKSGKISVAVSVWVVSHFHGNVIWFVVLGVFFKPLILGKQVTQTWTLPFKHHIKLLQKIQE